ncbi:MAG TPA: hypothetical protein PLU80_02505, partial [Acidobacteriota bacterium]|nr:hypothetical protein [Acidobacteriota bacterium]
MSLPLTLNDAFVGPGSRPGRDRGLRTTAIKRRPCGPKTLILAHMGRKTSGQINPGPIFFSPELASLQPQALSPMSSAPSPEP